MEEAVHKLLRRRSTRSYLDKPVPDDILKWVLDAGLHAPNGGGHQVVRLFTIRRPDTLAALNAVIRDHFAGRELDPSDYQNKTALRARTPGYHFMFYAPVLISAVAPRDHGNSMADSACALMNMQAAATLLDLGCCWVNQPHWCTDHPPLRQIFTDMGMAADEAIFGSIALGHPAKPAAQPPARKPGRLVFLDGQNTATQINNGGATHE